MRFRLLLLTALSAVLVSPARAGAQAGRTSTEPQLLKEVRPEYSPEGRAAGIEGCVSLSAEVLTDGTVGEVQVVRPLDRNEYRLDQIAVDALKMWIFKPAMQDGEAVTAIIHVGICFSLKENQTRKP